MKQREFRGLSVDRKMVYGFGCYVDESENEFIVNETASDNLFIIVRKGTLSEYLGFKDKSGKKIFVGDIVGFSDVSVAGTKDFAPIYWDKENLTYKADIGYEHRTFYQGMKDKTLEVIGNIHENPELK